MRLFKGMVCSATRVRKAARLLHCFIALSWSFGFIIVAKGTTFSVINTNDSGAGSLRQAILDANTETGTDLIAFNIPGVGPFVIQPVTPLPEITNSVIIDGYSQPGAVANSLTEGDNAIIKVRLDGVSTGAAANGLTISAGNCVVRGLSIVRFGGGVYGHGLYFSERGSNVVQGNFVGVFEDGITIGRNAASGVIFWQSANNTIGGVAPAARNVLAGNQHDGLRLSGNGSTNNSVLGNYLGTDAGGKSSITNEESGLRIEDASGNRVGGASVGSGNLISGGHTGVLIVSPASSNNVVEGNWIGLDSSGTNVLPNEFGISLSQCSSNRIGGHAIGAGNIISGNLFGGVRAFQSSSNLICGNWFGLGVTGRESLGNGYAGCSLENSHNNTIGGFTALARNVIAGTKGGGSGVLIISGSKSNLVVGNFVGTDITGTNAVANGAGVNVMNSAGNLIGSDLPGSRNVVSGNLGDGVVVLGSQSISNVIQGNVIGLDANGFALGNGSLTNQQNPGARLGAQSAFNILISNVISANLDGGVSIDNGAHDNAVQSNFIGTAISGLVAIGNTGSGIIVQSDAHDNLIEGNLISGNNGLGVLIGGSDGTSNNHIEGNWVGVDASGSGPLGNSGPGIGIYTGNSNTVGGLTVQAGNSIAFNGGDGVEITSGSGHAVQGNRIFNNAGLGIDLNANGVTTNDAGDADIGANGLQNFPILTTVGTGMPTSVSGTLSSTPNTVFHLDFYATSIVDPSGYGEGARYLGGKIVTTDGGGNVQFSAELAAATVQGEIITATATDPAGNSSEFSAGVAAGLYSPGSIQFFATNLVVVRLGGVAQPLTANGNSIFLDQYAIDGSLLNTVGIPDTGSTGVVMSGSSFVEGYLTRSLDGRFLCLPVYGTNLSSGANVTTSPRVARIVATFDAASNYKPALITTNDFRGLSWRGAATDGTNSFWGVGSSGGTIYLGSSSARSIVQNTKPNDRVLEIFNGNLYMASGSTAGDGLLGIYKFDGLPRTAVGLPAPIIFTNTFTGLNGISDFAVNPSGTIIYFADDRPIDDIAGGIQRWDFDSGANIWINTYHLTNGLSSTGTSHLAVDWTGPNPAIYAVTAGLSQNRLIKVVDTGSGSVAVTLAQAGTNQGFRGVKFGPSAGPPVILTHPRSMLAKLGGGAIFHVEANGTEPLSYSWQKNGSIIGAPSQPTLYLSNLLAGDAAVYSVVISNSFGAVVSSNAVMNIAPPSAIYVNDFESPVGNEWSSTQRSLSPIGGRGFLGEFGNQTVRLGLSNLPPHTVMKVAFDLFVLRTWDGNSTTDGPDRWKITLNGASPQLDTTFGFQLTVPNIRQSYPDNYLADYPPLTGAAEVNTLGYTYDASTRTLFADAVYPIRLATADASGTILLDFAASGLESITNESWGLDNINVEVLNVSSNELQGFALSPVPSTYPGNPIATSVRAYADFVGMTNVDVTATASWGSSNTNIFSVNSTGQILPRGAGSATLTASYLDHSTNAGVTVLAPLALRQTVVGTFIAGANTVNIPLLADFPGASNLNVTGFGGVVRSSSDPTIASLSATGNLTPLKAGSVVITATYAGLTNQSAVEVIAAPGFNNSLIAYEGFSYVDGSDLSGLAGGYGWTGTWTATILGDTVVSNGVNGSLVYTDALGNTLLTSGNSFVYSAAAVTGTDSRTFRDLATPRGADNTTTWISFLGQRTGPVTNLTSNPYPRGATPISLYNGSTEILAIGNTSGAASNTWGLAPAGQAANLQSSTNSFSQVSLVVVKIDHKTGNDDAYLFINPPLGVEPPPETAAAKSLGGFDFSFNRVRPFVGANDAANGRPYAELQLDELRVGATYASVTPFAPSGTELANYTYTQDFEGTIGNEWSTNTVNSTASGGRKFLGEFGNQTVRLSLGGLPAHTLARVSFDLFTIRSWDGNSTAGGPDVFRLARSDGFQLFRTTFNNHYSSLSGFAGVPSTIAAGQAFPGPYVTAASAPTFPPQTGAAEINTLGYTFQGPWPSAVPQSAVYRLSGVMTHTATSLSLDFSGSGLEGLANESWGLDNVRVEIFNLNASNLLSLAFQSHDVSSLLGNPVPTGTTLIGTFTGAAKFELTRAGGVSYSSSDASVFTVNTNGEVSPKGVGIASLIASYQGLSATTSVSVIGPTAIRQDNPGELLAGGIPITLNLFADFANVSNVNVSGYTGVDRASSNSTVASITAPGLLTPRNPGATIVTASFAGLTNRMPVSVVLPLGFRPGLLVHRYSFNEAPDTTIVSDVISGANGTVVNLSSGSTNNNFTGTGQLRLAGGAGGSTSAAFVNLPNGLVSGRQSVTFEGWVTWRGTNSIWQRIFDFGRNQAFSADESFVEDQFNTTGASYLMFTPRSGATGNFMRFTLKQGTGTEPFTDGTTALPLGVEAHFVVVYDPPSGLTRVYVNGQRVATGTAFMRLNTIEDFNDWLGRSQWSNDSFFEGSFNEFRIYDGALLDEEVQASYAAGPNGFAGLIAPPLNDAFLNAIPLSSPVATVVTANVGASKEADEPNHAGNAGGKSVWWSWIAPASGAVTVDTFGSSFDTLLSVYTGNSLSNLTVVASNDNSGGPNSQVSFAATAATTYFIAVDGSDGAVGRIVLKLSANIAPQTSVAPASRTVSAGYDAAFGGLAAGIGPFSYQWQRDAAPISGATGVSYSITNVQTYHAGNYGLAVSGTFGTGLSSNILLVVEPPYEVTPLAGLPGTAGTANGASNVARFNNPHDVALDSSGNLYVAEHGNSAIRKITPDGTVATLAGLPGTPGSADGTGTAARFNNPWGVCAGSNGIVFVADSGNHKIRRITANGVVTTIAGLAGSAGSVDATGTAARFSTPRDVATDPLGNLYVADFGNHTIRKITAAGVVTTIAGRAGIAGTMDGQDSGALFSNPGSIVLDGAGQLFVADMGNDTIRKLTLNGTNWVVTTLAGLAGAPGAKDGIGRDARFRGPSGLGVDAAGNIYVAEYVVHTIRKISPAGVVSTLAGLPNIAGNATGVGRLARMNGLRGITSDGEGNLYVADFGNHAIRKAIPSAGVSLTQVPVNQVQSEEADVELTVQATGRGPFLYQWLFNGGVLIGATNATLHLHPLTLAQDGQYQTRVRTFDGLEEVFSQPITMGVRKLSWQFFGTPGLSLGVSLGDVWARRTNEAYVLGWKRRSARSDIPDTFLYRWNGTNWGALASFPGHYPGRLLGVGTNELWITLSRCALGPLEGCGIDRGGKVYRSIDGGANWTEHILPAQVSNREFRTLSGNAGDVQLVAEGGIILRFNGITWNVVYSNPTESVNAHVLLSGSEGYYVNCWGWGDWDGNGWNFQGRQFDFCDVSATWAQRDATGALQWYAVGANNFANGIRVWKFDSASRSFGGKTNYVFSEGNVSGIGSATGVWGSAPDDVYVIGSLANTPGGAPAGRIYHFNGNSWSRVTEFGEISPPTGIHGTDHDDIWIALQDGRLLRRNSRVGTNEAPGIVTPPGDQAVVVNKTATFAVAAQGTPNLFYQWQFNASSLAGATNPLLVLPSIQLNNAGQYQVTVSNAFGSVTSAPVNLEVIVPPSFATQPGNTNITINGTITLSVSVSGADEYQWRKNGANIKGATNASFTIPNVQFSDGGSYTVVVANDAGAVTSDRAEVIVTPNAPPAAADMFTNRLSLSLLLTGGPPAVVSGFNTNASKELDEPLHANRLGGRSVWYTWQAPSNGIARFNTYGSTFDTVLAVYTGGDLVSLKEVAANDDDDSNDPALATNRFFASEVRFNAHAGTNYSIAVDGFGGESGYFVLMGELQITPNLLPEITNQPVSQVDRLGTNVTFSVGAQGINLAYQWYFNGLSIAGATAPTLTRSNIGANSVGTYSVRVSNTNAGLYLDSQRAILEISSDPDQGIVLQDKLDRLVRSGALPRPSHSKASVVTTSQGDYTGFYSVAAGTVGYHLGNNIQGRTDLGEVNHAGLIGSASLYLSFETTNAGTLLVDTRGSGVDNLFAVYRDNVNYDELVHGLLGYTTNSANATNVNSVAVTNGPGGGQFLVVADGVRDHRGTLQINWSFGTAPKSNLSTNAALVQTLNPGDTLTLRLTDPAVTNAAPKPVYRWYRDDQFLAETTVPFLVLSQAGLANSGTYRVVSQNELGITTNVLSRLLINQPLNVTKGSGKYQAGVFEFALNGREGDSVVVQATTNLARWQNLSLEHLAGYERTFRDLQAGSFPGRYYRVVREGSYLHLASSLLATGAGMAPGLGYRFTLPPSIEIPIIIEASPDLQTWLTLATIPTNAAPTLFTDPTATNAPRRYYRLRLSP